MNLKNLALIPALCLLQLVTACGNDCKSGCDDEKKCSGANASADCDSFCDKGDSIADDAKCKNQWDDLTSCIADQKNVCQDQETACAAKRDGFFVCVAPYCQASAHTAECTAWFASSPLPMGTN